MIVIVIGLPGSGKSYFAMHAAQMLNADYISSDRLRREMFTEPSYSVEERLLVYDEMMREMIDTAQQGKYVILDATFHKSNIRQKFIDKAKNISPVHIIEVYADDDLIKKRLLLPREDSDAGFEVYKSTKKEWEPFNDEHLILRSTNDNITEMLERTADYFFEENDKRKHP